MPLPPFVTSSVDGVIVRASVSTCLCASMGECELPCLRAPGEEVCSCACAAGAITGGDGKSAIAMPPQKIYLTCLSHF